MRKIYFVSPFNPYRGGIAQFSDALVKELQNKFQIHKINYKRLYPSFLFPGKSQFIENSSIDSLKDGVIDSINLFSTLKLISLLKKESNQTVLISVFWMSFFAPILGFLSKFSPKKITRLALVHNLIPHEPRFFDSFLIRFYVNNQDAFIVLSEKVKNDILKIKPSASVVSLFHPLYDHFGDKIEKGKAREKYGISNDKKVILFFGLIRDYKGLDLLLKTFSLLDDSYVLIIAGECYGSFEKYQIIINENNMKHKIIHLDSFIPDSEVPFLFSASDVCVLPYKKATQSGVTATALHFEIPIVSTNVGGLIEYVKHGKTGYLVTPENINELEMSIINACDEKINHKMINEIKVFKNKLSWKHFSDELDLFIQTLS